MTSHVRRQALYELLQRKEYWSSVVRDNASRRTRTIGLSDEHKDLLWRTEEFFRTLLEEDDRLIQEFVTALREEMQQEGDDDEPGS